MESAERIIKISQLMVEKFTELFEDERTPGEFSIHELITGTNITLLQMVQTLVQEEDENLVLGVNDITRIVGDGLNEITSYVAKQTIDELK